MCHAEPTVSKNGKLKHQNAKESGAINGMHTISLAGGLTDFRSRLCLSKSAFCHPDKDDDDCSEHDPPDKGNIGAFEKEAAANVWMATQTMQASISMRKIPVDGHACVLHVCVCPAPSAKAQGDATDPLAGVDTTKVRDIVPELPLPPPLHDAEQGAHGPHSPTQSTFGAASKGNGK